MVGRGRRWRALHAFVDDVIVANPRFPDFFKQTAVGGGGVGFVVPSLGIPFALASPRSGGRAMGIGMTIAIAVSYWMVHSVSLTLAQADLLPPTLAAWTANVIFAGLGTALYLNART